MPSSRKRLINADPIEEGIDYAERVVARKIPAGKFVRLAAERFLEDRRKAKAGQGPWIFDPDRALAPIEICQQLPNIKGPLADQPIRLMPWQLCWTANLFGFVERETGWRRFRQASIWVPRGNGKSTWLAPLAVNCAFCEREGGAEAYAAAVTRDQSKIVWSTAHEMLRRVPELRHYLGVEQSAHSIFQPRTASSFLPLSSDAKSLDGLNVHFACLDEVGSHRTARVYDIILTALGKRLQPLLISISTATANTTGIGKQLWDLSVKVLTGALEDERFFAVLYTADEGDNPFAEATLAKANPSWGLTVVPEQVRMIARQARNNPAQEAVYAPAMRALSRPSALSGTCPNRIPSATDGSSRKPRPVGPSSTAVTRRSRLALILGNPRWPSLRRHHGTLRIGGFLSEPFSASSLGQ